MSISRRKFLGMVGIGTTAAYLGGPAWGTFELAPAELERWKKSLFNSAGSRIYLSDKHIDARMHLGGIGTGNFEIGADGQVTTWQLFNTLREGEVPFYFGVKAGPTAKLLQTAGGPDWPRVKGIKMTGDYPVATLRFEDPDLPVQIVLEAFTPFGPLDTADSSLPLAIFNFRVRNETAQPQTVSLAALMANPVGYAAIGRIDGASHPSLGFNVNETFCENDAAGLLLRARGGADPTLDKPVDIYVLDDVFTFPPDPKIITKNFAHTNWHDIAIPPLDRPEKLKVHIIDVKTFSSDAVTKPAQTVIWLENLPASFPKPLLAEIAKTVKKGAALIISDNAAKCIQPLDPTLLSDKRVSTYKGRLLDCTYSARSRQRVYQRLCALAGADYTVTDGQSTKEPGFGTLALAAPAKDASALVSFEDWHVAWEQFQREGRFAPVADSASSSPTPPCKTTNAALAATVTIAAGDTMEIPFLLTWHYPNKYNAAGKWIGSYYATRWADARSVMGTIFRRYQVLRSKTELFQHAFYDSTLPYWLLDCMSANAATMRHIGVVFRIANGDVYGWEGSNGSCDPTCTHVWGYEQAFAHLFPTLEKEMRRIDFTHQQRDDGGINNRTAVPSPPHPTREKPFTDGHASCVLKAYREALNSPDETFFQSYWPNVKRAVEYLIARDKAAAGSEASGVLRDDQWNTYDEALHGVTSFISGYYLAALRAGEEWARRLGESQTAERFHAIFERGQNRLIELCWNGEYFQQNLPDYAQRKGEIGPGCMSDQLIGQWWAHQLGLGYILPEDKAKSALRSIYQYNFKTDLTGWKHLPRPFAGDGDKGLVVCTWPKGGRPANVMLYSDEVWTGVEYQVAAHMIYEGMVEEAFTIVKGARDRYDGVPRPPIQRNPWCEIECGGHYARAMSSWSLLEALSGFACDGPRGRVCFAPRYHPEKFKSLFTSAQGWGWLAQSAEEDSQTATIAVAAGALPVTTLELAPFAGKTQLTSATLAGKRIPPVASTTESRLRLDFGKAGVVIGAGEKLVVNLASK